MSGITIDHFAALLGSENVTQKKSFGMPALFVNGNMFLSIMPEGVAYKMSAADINQALTETGGKAMQMKGWVEIPFSANVDWIRLAECALDHVSSLPPKDKKKSKR
jgi:hypothetical protein